MKTSSFISTAALLGSVIAIFLATRHPQTPAQSDIDARVDARLAVREQKFVQAFAPNIREMLAGTADAEYGASWCPKTMEELMEPVAKIIAAMGQTTPSEEDRNRTEQ